MTGLHNIVETDISWDNMTYAEKDHRLYLKQKELLDQYLKRGAITQNEKKYPVDKAYGSNKKYTEF